MHEVTLAQEIVAMVETTAQREHFTQVARLRLEAGSLAGVDVGALRFALESMVGGTCLAQAAITIDEPQAMGWCSHCAAEVPMQQRMVPCPQCQNYPLRPVNGHALKVLDLIVRDT